MAFSKSVLYSTVWGNKRVVGLLVTADAASGSVDSGLSVIESVSGLTPVSMATAGIKVKKNLSAASASANGQILLSSCATGDAFEIVCVGK